MIISPRQRFFSFSTKSNVNLERKNRRRALNLLENDGDRDGVERKKNALFMTAKPLTSEDVFLWIFCLTFKFKIIIWGLWFINNLLNNMWSALNGNFINTMADARVHILLVKIYEDYACAMDLFDQIHCCHHQNILKSTNFHIFPTKYNDDWIP